MKMKDLIWAGILVFFAAFLAYGPTREMFVSATSAHPYIMSFIKFFILATMGELLAIRITSGDWKFPLGWIWRAVIWGFLGIVIALVFQIFSAGVSGAIDKGYLPGKGSVLAFAFFTSATMNLSFAPTMMAFHRLSDTLLDIKYEGDGAKATIGEAISRIDWHGFVTFVVMKTIPFFWIPAHTAVFLLPPVYRVMAAAALSIALGGILAMAKRKKTA
ncbi:MAG: hypothetical protein C0604_08165 [Clostridiales bacterium]|nr:MAG: hypothetical protein C0604_08165 [Clostridiales bacterium]